MTDIRDKLRAEMIEAMDDPYRGLKETSNTNKTRQTLLGILDEALEINELTF